MTEAEQAARTAADAIAWLRLHEVRRLVATQGGPRGVRTPARLDPDQLAASYRQAGLRNPRRSPIRAAE